MSLLVNFREQHGTLSKLKFGVEYIVSKNYVTFQDDFSSFFDNDPSTDILCSEPWDSILKSCQIILANFGYMNLNDHKMHVITENIVSYFLKLFKIRSDPTKFKKIKFISALETLAFTLESLGKLLPECHSKFSFYYFHSLITLIPLISSLFVL